MPEGPAVLAEFTARLRKGKSRGARTYLVMKGSADVLGTRGNVKVRGTIDHEPFETSFMPLGDGTHMLPVKAVVRKAIGKEAGDSVRVRILERAKSRAPSRRPS